MTDYEFGDIVLVDFPHSGAQTVKRRPALVVLDGSGAPGRPAELSAPRASE